jgi:hypothetical protein
MLQSGTGSRDFVVGPSGEVLSKDDLPPSDTTRWVAKRKAQVAAAVNGGLLSIAEACDRYDLTLEELSSWQRSLEKGGMAGLKVSRLQHLRQAPYRSQQRTART